MTQQKSHPEIHQNGFFKILGDSKYFIQKH